MHIYIYRERKNSNIFYLYIFLNIFFYSAYALRLFFDCFLVETAFEYTHINIK